MSQASTDAAYTQLDHEFRESDPYARAKYELTLRWLPRNLAPGEITYNIGVGSGYFNHLAVRRGLRVIGCEPDPVAFARARESAPSGVELLQGGLEEFAANRDPARLVVMHDVLEHIADDRGAVALLRRLVRSDGRAIISVPALMSLFGLHDEQLGHYRRYTPATLRSVLAAHFTVRRFRWYGMASIPIAFYFSRWKRKPYPVGAVGTSPLGALYGMVCQAEGYLAEPIGTSIIVELTPRG